MGRVLPPVLLIALALAPATVARGGPDAPATKSLRLGSVPLSSLTSEDRALLASLGQPRP